MAAGIVTIVPHYPTLDATDSINSSSLKPEVVNECVFGDYLPFWIFNKHEKEGRFSFLPSKIVKFVFLI